jgi:hypothetical protein
VIKTDQHGPEAFRSALTAVLVFPLTPKPAKRNPCEQRSSE